MNLDDNSENSGAGGAPAWAITFSDLTLNMLCMFALMLSFSKFRSAEFNDLAGSVRAAFGAPQAQKPEPVVTTAELRAGKAASTANIVQAHETLNACSRTDVERLVRERGLGASVEVENSPRGVVLRVRDRTLFDSGSAEVRADAEVLLGVVLDLAKNFPGTLAVEGHTDDRPIHSLAFPSNWELSAARAASVLRYLSAAGLKSESLHIAGYADQRPLVSNEEVDGRSRNRRVEFVFEPEFKPEFKPELPPERKPQLP